MLKSELPGALVLGPPFYFQVVGAVRSLGRQGIPAYALAHSGRPLWSWSRHCAGLVEAGKEARPDPQHPERTLEQLLAAGRDLGTGAVLVPASDDWAVFVAENQAELSPSFRSLSPAAATVGRLVSKLGLSQLAAESGVPGPRTVLPTSLEELRRLARSLSYPVLVKPVHSLPRAPAKTVVESADQLVAVVTRAGLGELVCQELVERGDAGAWMFEGYFDRESRCLAGFTARKLRQEPNGIGMAAAARLEPNDELRSLAISFLGGIGFRGLVDADFRWDSTEGRFKIVDLNPRLGGAFRLFTDRRGLDVLSIMYWDLVGKPLLAAEQSNGRKWVHEHAYFVDGWHHRGIKALSPAGIVSDLLGVHEFALLSALDPLPAMGVAASMVRDRFRRGRRLRIPAALADPVPQ